MAVRAALRSGGSARGARHSTRHRTKTARRISGSSSDARPSGVPRVQRRSLDRGGARLVAAVPSFTPRVVRLLALVPSARSRARCCRRRRPRAGRRVRVLACRQDRAVSASGVPPPQRARRRPRRPRRVHPRRGQNRRRRADLPSSSSPTTTSRLWSRPTTSGSRPAPASASATSSAVTSPSPPSPPPRPRRPRDGERRVQDFVDLIVATSSPDDVFGYACTLRLPSAPRVPSPTTSPRVQRFRDEPRQRRALHRDGEYKRARGWRGCALASLISATAARTSSSATGAAPWC